MLLNHYAACRGHVALATAAVLGAASVCWPGRLLAADFVLTRDGQPVATIVTAATASPAATTGAQELQYHVRKITGATLPIRTDTEKIDGSRILVGPSAATARLGLQESQFGDQEYLIRCRDNDLVLLGREQGTLYAVYDFLERCCDVRWYGPGESQMVLPQTATLAVRPLDVRRKPAFVWRAVSPDWGSESLTMGRALYGNPSAPELNLFWSRLRLGGEAYACNHSFQGYDNRFWKKYPDTAASFVAAHPEWFAQGYTESELKDRDGLPPQLCFSSQGLLDQVVADARKYFDGRGLELGAVAAGRYFAMVPMDAGGRAGWCKCPACQAQIDKERWVENRFDSNGSASEYWFAFVNQVARQIATSHPDTFISTLAYAGYSYRPRQERLEPNISVQLCLHTRNWWVPGMAENELAFYRDWVDHEKGRPLYLWLYYLMPEWTPGPRITCFPGFFAHTLAQQIKMFARDGIRGAFIEGVSDQVDTYLTFKLLDDPSLDVDVLLEEFFTRYYGAAATPMKRLYLRIEEIYSDPANYPDEVRHERKQDFFQTEEMAWRYLGTEARLAELGALMDDAARLAVAGPEKQRVALFRKAVWDHMVAGRRQYLTRNPPQP
jgi:hypothetical protein